MTYRVFKESRRYEAITKKSERDWKKLTQFL
jgi:hypothetical protein